MSASERKIADLEAKVRELQHLLSQQMKGGETLWFESGVSSRTGKAFVHLRWENLSGQLTPAEARQHAMDMIETAHAAEFDEAFVRAMTTPEPDGPNFPLEGAMGMLAMIREARTGDPDSSMARGAGAPALRGEQG